jgi:hypothetical protein
MPCAGRPGQRLSIHRQCRSLYVPSAWQVNRRCGSPTEKGLRRFPFQRAESVRRDFALGYGGDRRSFVLQLQVRCICSNFRQPALPVRDRGHQADCGSVNLTEPERQSGGFMLLSLAVAPIVIQPGSQRLAAVPEPSCPGSRQRRRVCINVNSVRLPARCVNAPCHHVFDPLPELFVICSKVGHRDLLALRMRRDATYMGRSGGPERQA